MSAYFRFVRDRRKEREASEDTKGAKMLELNRQFGQEWKELSEEVRQKYNTEANVDRLRYNEEMKEFLAKGGKVRESKPKKIKKKKKVKTKALFKSKNPNLKAPMIHGPLVEDVPIFTQEFLEHNKRSEGDLRTLKKTCAEVEEQNALLLRECSRLDSAILKSNEEIDRYRRMSDDMDAWLKKHRNELVIAFSMRELPGVPRPTLENIDEFVKISAEKLKSKNSAFSIALRNALAMKRGPQPGRGGGRGRGRGTPKHSLHSVH